MRNANNHRPAVREGDERYSEQQDQAAGDQDRAQNWAGCVRGLDKA